MPILQRVRRRHMGHIHPDRHIERLVSSELVIEAVSSRPFRECLIRCSPCIGEAVSWQRAALTDSRQIDRYCVWCTIGLYVYHMR